jgi:DUF1009 family protein
MLALIAGRGRLPAAVAAAQDSPPLICALEGFAPDGLTPEITFRLETLGSFLLTLGERGVTDICLCGSIDRPKLDPDLLDVETAPLVPILHEALSQGDDGALRAVMGLLERTGFTIRAAHELAPALLPDAGVPTKRQPQQTHRADVTTALAVLADQGRADLGQACVVKRGQVLAREGDEGTDAMLQGLSLPREDRGWDGDPITWSFDLAGDMIGQAADWLSNTTEDAPDAPGAGAILFKAPKPGQDRRADLPTIGPGTAMRAAEAGLDGIVIEAGGVIVLDQPQVVAICDAMGMFLWVR